jgi:hypothetical protein
LAVYIPIYYKLGVTEENHKFWLKKFLRLRVAEMANNDGFFQRSLMKESVCGHSFIGFVAAWTNPVDAPVTIQQRQIYFGP